jgi:hypothetical protein
MACYHPSPIDVDTKLQGDQTRRDSVTVPCGKCLGCRADQGREWAIRIKHEADLQPLRAYFVTLTYNELHLPGTWPDDQRITGTLDPDDTTLFLKKLRHRTRNKIGYYYCGEYGERNGRPHYHFALFGAPLFDKVKVGERNGYAVFHSQQLTDLWGMGNVEVTDLTWEAASYVAGYVTKKAAEKANPTNHLRVDPGTGEIFTVHEEFSRMSRRPALGRRWLEQHWQDVYPRDFVMMNGFPIKPPRYYDRRMDEMAPEIMEQVRYQRWKDAVEIGDDQLIMKEKVHRARNKTFFNRGKI